MQVSTVHPAQRVIRAPAVLGLPTREEFRHAANELLDEMAEGNGQLVVDLSETREVDSSGLNVLVMIHRHASDRRQAVVLRGVGPQLEYLLVLTKLDDLFAFEPGVPTPPRG